MMDHCNNSNHNGITVVVRHSGRAHVRGKIRRIWRPRYLELCDNGLVRYYELPPSTIQHDDNKNQKNKNDDDAHHVGMIPKCTLLIRSARIIDVTTLRDMHVGLPRGTYGFCMSGLRQLFISSSAVVNISEECVGVSGIMTTEQQEDERDFLCAVPTLEEAQSWVVALQWASRLQTTISPATTESCWADILAEPDDDMNDLSSLPDENDLYADDDDDDELYAAAASRHGISARPRLRHQNVLQVMPTVLKRSSSSTAATRTRRVSPKATTTTTTKQPPSGKIVVCKMRSTSFVRLATGVDLAYRIQLLLLKPPAQTVEERSLLRTLGEIRHLIRSLQQEELSSSSSRKVVKSARDQVDKIKSSSSSTMIYKDYMTSLSTMDAILRSFAMDAGICNSSSLRKFWALDHYVKQSFPLLQVHDSHTILSQTTRQIPAAPDVFVKEWLQMASWEQFDEKKQVLFWILQHSLVVLSSLILPVVLVRPLLYVRKHWIFTLHLKLDVLLVTWAAAYMLGTVLERRRRQDKQAASVSVSGKTKHKGDGVSLLGDDDEQQPISSDDEDGDDILVLQDDETVMTTTALLAESKRSTTRLSSPLPQYPSNGGISCWSKPKDEIFRVRSKTYLQDRVKLPSDPSPFTCLGVDVWLTDNPERHIARHPSVLGGKLAGSGNLFLVNFLLPFGHLVAYFDVPPLNKFPPELANVWTKFLQGDQQYRDARLKLLPVVVDGPWIVKTAVGPGTAPALLGKVIPLQYYFRSPCTQHKHGIYEVDVIITASRIAKGILSVVKGHTQALTIAFAFIIEAAEQEELPETVLCSFQMHSLNLEDCPQLPECNLDEYQMARQ